MLLTVAPENRLKKAGVRAQCAVFGIQEVALGSIPSNTRVCAHAHTYTHTHGGERKREGERG